MFIHIFINFLLFFFSECDRKQPVTYLSDVWNYFITNPELITLTQYICKDKVINFFWLPKLIPYKDYCYEWKRENFDSAIKPEARLWSYWCSVFVLTLYLGDDQKDMDAMLLTDTKHSTFWEFHVCEQNKPIHVLKL